MSPQFPVPRAAVLLVPVLALALQMPAGRPLRSPWRRPIRRTVRRSSRCSRRRTCRSPQRGDRTRNLDFLFGALKAAPDADSAKQVENRIWALWLASGSDTANLLMSRVKTAIEANDLDLADQAARRPGQGQAGLRRGLEPPRHHPLHAQGVRPRVAGHSAGADRASRAISARMSGLGMILQEFGDEKHALEVFRRALAINPHLPKIPDMVKTLSEKVEGRDI